MLRPTEGITNCRCFFRTRGSNQCVRNLVKKRRRNATDFLYHLRRVAREVAAQRLENAPWVLQGQIALRETKAAIAIVEPGLPVITTLFPAPAGENASRAFFRVAKIFAKNAGSIGEVHDVFRKKKVVLDNVPNEAAKKRDVAAGANRHPDISQCASARKSGIDMNDRRATLLRLHYPAEADRMRLGH